MSPETILDHAVTVSLGILCLSFLVTIYRIVKGPTLPDRILGLDMLVAIAIGFIAVVGIKTGYSLYVDVAIALGLVGFLATVAFARFVLSRGKTEEDLMSEARAAEAAARRGRKETGGLAGAPAQRPATAEPGPSPRSKGEGV